MPLFLVDVDFRIVGYAASVPVLRQSLPSKIKQPSRPENSGEAFLCPLTPSLGPRPHSASFVYASRQAAILQAKIEESTEPRYRFESFAFRAILPSGPIGSDLFSGRAVVEGLPGEDQATIRANYQSVRTLRPFTSSFSSTPSPSAFRK